MKANTDHIATSHVGSLPRPDSLIAAFHAVETGKPMSSRVQYGSWWRYSWGRLGGLKTGTADIYQMAPHRSKPGEVVLTSFGDRRDRTTFAEAYGDPESGITHHGFLNVLAATRACLDGGDTAGMLEHVFDGMFITHGLPPLGY